MAMPGRGFVTGTPGFGARRQAAMALAVLADREAEGLDRPTGRRQERAWTASAGGRFGELGKEEERGRVATTGNSWGQDPTRVEFDGLGWPASSAPAAGQWLCCLI
jgi:hypothetical protein